MFFPSVCVLSPCRWHEFPIEISFHAGEKDISYDDDDDGDRVEFRRRRGAAGAKSADDPACPAAVRRWPTQVSGCAGEREDECSCAREWEEWWLRLLDCVSTELTRSIFLLQCLRPRGVVSTLRASRQRTSFPTGGRRRLDRKLQDGQRSCPVGDDQILYFIFRWLYLGFDLSY